MQETLNCLIKYLESSMKALELTYRLDGSMSDLTNEPDYDEVTKNRGNKIINR